MSLVAFQVVKHLYPKYNHLLPSRSYELNFIQTQFSVSEDYLANVISICSMDLNFNTKFITSFCSNISETAFNNSLPSLPLSATDSAICSNEATRYSDLSFSEGVDRVPVSGTSLNPSSSNVCCVII